MDFTFLWNSGRFVARAPGGSDGFPTPTLQFPDDFPGYPGLSPTLEVQVESVWLRIQASAVVATRRARVKVLTDQAFTQAEAISNATIAAAQTRQFQFSQPGVLTQGGTLLNAEPLPVMVLGQPWSLVVDIQGADVNDILSDVVVQGRYLV